MKRTIVVIIWAALSFGASADEKADRAGIPGAWTAQKSARDGWIIREGANGIHLTQIEDAGTIADFECRTDGHDCEVKVSGHKATVSMYYNGSALVELETRGDKVVKRRFTALPSGNSLKVELIPITGKGRSEEFQFERGQPSEAKR